MSALPSSSHAHAADGGGRGEAAITRWPRCPVCGSTLRASWVEFEPLAFERCQDCGTVYKSRERPVRPGDFYEHDYFHGRKSGREKRFEHRVGKAMRQLRGAIGFARAPVRAALDIGCSLGYVVEAARRLGLTAAGTDVSEYAVKICRERGLRAELGTLERLPFGDREFDLVVMKHVLEHTPDPARALAEVRRVLGPTGLVLIAVPDLEYWKGLWRRRSYRYFRPDDLGMQHYVYYTERSLPQLLERAGFQVLATSKAFRRPDAGPGVVGAGTELARHALVATWQWLARTFHLRRELYVTARVAEAAH